MSVELDNGKVINPNSAIPQDTSLIRRNATDSLTGGGGLLLTGRRYGNDNPLIPSYWSRNRDKELIKLAYNNDYLLTAFINAMLILLGIDFTIEPKDINSDSDRQSAELATRLIEACVDKDELVPFLFDLFTTDNGGFLEILGISETGDTTEPLAPIDLGNGIILPALGFRHLSSLRCTRTGDGEFPVIYLHTDGREYKLHRSRVYFTQQMRSADPLHYGIGLCVLSRILTNITQNQATEKLLIDMTYDGMVGGLMFAYPFTGDQLRSYFEEAEIRQKTLKPDPSERHLNTLLIGSEKEPPTVEYHQLRRLPENFNHTEDTQRLFNLIAGTIGISPRQLWPVSSTTQADADIANQNSKTKLPAWWVKTYSSFLNNHFLPSYLTAESDYVDDEQAKQRNESHKLLAETFKLDIEGQLLSIETALEVYLRQGIITQAQFDREIARVQNPITPITLQTGNIANIQTTGEPLFAERKDIVYTMDDGTEVIFDRETIETAFRNAPDDMRRLLEAISV